MQMVGSRPGPRALLVAVLGAGVIGSGAVLAGLVGSSPAPTSISVAAPVDPGLDHDHDHDHASQLDDDGRFTGPGDVWPPQPVGATDVVTGDETGLAAPADGFVAAGDEAQVALVAQPDAVTVALADPAVAAAVPGRYSLIAVSDGEQLPGTAKGSVDPDAAKVVLYDLDGDTSVEVIVDGDRVVDVSIRSALEHQPPLSEEEKTRAAELARAHWAAVGDDRLDQLQAFIILDMADSGGFHPTRVAYVSFHVDTDARPELLTWVDLSSETILDSRVDR